MMDVVARREKMITVGAWEITVREPTVNELLGMLKQMVDGDAQPDPFGDHVLDGISFRELELFTGLTIESLGRHTLGELDEIGKACMEFNPFFFGWKDRIVRMARSMPSATLNPAPSI
ncbi:MAG: hypothetical protein HQM01_10105 [Magnetococcales bacterium]|nr:hypothetical protein [Magnetococcales bacterium]